jgi:filamentous hemagglutinin family protein
MTLSVATAQNISIDGRFSRAQTLNAVGGNYAITADLGKLVGSNLFHSFGKFGLSTGESAAFSGPTTVSNVIGRVTGGSRSDIDGRIQSNIAGANLYLINPSGIVFGRNATVNVSGSFHASTADYLRMSDGAKFQATNPDASTFSAAPPAAFGFLTATPANIMVNGSGLGVSSGQTLGLVAGPVSISGPTPTAAPRANLSAPAGTIHVTTVAGTGEVPVDPRNVSALTVTSFGRVDIGDGSTRATLRADTPSGPGSGGSVFIRSGTLTVDFGTITATNAGSGPGGQLFLRGDNQVTLRNRALVQALTSGPGAGGDVALTAGNLTITPGASILAVTTGPGSGGNIAVNVSGLLSIDGTSSAIPTGIFAESLTLLFGPLSTGNAGNVTVNAGTLRLVTNGRIAADTLGAAGSAGTVTVKVAGKLSIDGTSQMSAVTGITSESGFGPGNAGLVRVNARSLAITNGGAISASTHGPGAGGDVAVTVTDDIMITGGLGILAETFGSGSGGSVEVTTRGPLTLSDPGSSITASATSTAGGNAGSVRVSASQIALMAGSEISSTTAGTGAGGSVDVRTPGALVLDGAGTANTQIAASAFGAQSGRGGSVTINADSLTIEHGARVASTTAGPGRGGDINITVGSDIVLRDPGPRITAQSTGSGDMGSITVSAVRMSMSNGATISTEAEAPTANGGNITLKLRDFLHLVGSQISASVKGETGDGGNILIDPLLVILDHSSSIIAQAVAGHGGNITINADQFIQSSDSIVSASSRRGISGTVVINGLVNANGALVVLSTQLRGRTEVLREACESRASRPLSSLVDAGRGGLPQDPEATLPALYIAGREVSPSSQTRADIIEASSALRTTLHLTMRCG